MCVSRMDMQFMWVLSVARIGVKLSAAIITEGVHGIEVF